MTTIHSADVESGDLIRELGNLFRSYAGNNSAVISVPQIREALNSISLYPSKFQIYELVHCACENNGRHPSDHLTFGEFSILVVELRENYKKNYAPPVPLSLLQEKQAHALLERRHSRRDKSSSYKVFLGGSCKPTTWRDDHAVPFFDQSGISYFNPEVSEWSEHLIEIEDMARQTAEILFFVIDNQTRSTASLVEAAYLAGCGRQLVLVIKPFEEKVVVKGEILSDKEVEGLERSRAYLTDLVERSGIPIFSNLQDALKSTSRIVKENLLVSDLRKEDGVWPVRFPYVRVADRFMKMFECFHDIDPAQGDRLNIQGVDRAYWCLTGHHLPSDFVTANANKLFSFDDFCLVVVEFRYCPVRSMPGRILNNIISFPSKFAGWFLPRKQLSNDNLIRDVFLGGTCGTSTWRDLVVIPKLKNHELTYYNPQVAQWSVSYIPMEAEAKDHSRVLLYVIGRESRGITSMLEVAYYIGRGCDVVLCIEYLSNDGTVEGESLTAVGVSDYNRARTYLKDLAHRDGIPVFDSINDAVDHITAKFRHVPSQKSLSTARCSKR